MPGNISTWHTMFRWRLLDFLVMSHDTSFVPKCLFSMYQMFGKRRSHSWKKAFILQHQPGPNRKLLCKYIPYCQMQFHILLKCMLLYRSTQIFISSVYTFWVVRAADEETVFFTSTHSLVTAPVSSDFPCLAAPGSALLHSRRAGLMSVASVEECDDRRLYHSDGAKWSAPPWWWNWGFFMCLLYSRILL